MAEYKRREEVLHEVEDKDLKSHIDVLIKYIKEEIEKISVKESGRKVCYGTECVNTTKGDAEIFFEAIDFGFKKEIPFKILHRHLEFFKQNSDKQSAIKEIEEAIYSVLEIPRDQFEIKIRPLVGGE